MKHLSIRAYAKRRGVTQQAVQKAIKQGRITRGPGGRINPTKADKDWAAMTTPPVAAATPAGATDGTFAQARAARELFTAKRAKLAWERDTGELISRAEVEAASESRAAEEREALMNLPARVAGQLAAELGADQRRTQLALESIIREHLAERSQTTKEKAA